MKKAIFLDRDGTINEDVGYICSPDKFHFIDRSVDALKMLQQSYELFIVTNQSGVARGYFSEDDLKSFNEYIENVLREKGIDIKQTYYCPHLKEDNCICYKPKSYFLRKAEKDFDIDLENSCVIGDHPHDIEMAKDVNASSIYVLTGHGVKHRKELIVQPDCISNNLYEASQWIIYKQTNPKDNEDETR